MLAVSGSSSQTSTSWSAHAKRGSRGRVVKAGAAVEHERPDELAEPGEQGAVGGLVELLGALGVGGGGGDHQPVGAAAELRVQLRGGELAVDERSGEQVVDEDRVVGHEPPAERSPVGIGLDGHDSVAAQERQQRAEQRRGRGLADAALGGDDGDRRARRRRRPRTSWSRRCS